MSDSIVLAEYELEQALKKVDKKFHGSMCSAKLTGEKSDYASSTFKIDISSRICKGEFSIYDVRDLIKTANKAVELFDIITRTYRLIEQGKIEIKRKEESERIESLKRQALLL